MEGNFPRLINVRKLEPGMTVHTLRGGKFTPDCHLGKRFDTGSKFPIIAFEQKGGGVVVTWHPCGHVWASVG